LYLFKLLMLFIIFMFSSYIVFSAQIIWGGSSGLSQSKCNDMCFGYYHSGADICRNYLCSSNQYCDNGICRDKGGTGGIECSGSLIWCAATGSCLTPDACYCATHPDACSTEGNGGTDTGGTTPTEPTPTGTRSCGAICGVGPPDCYCSGSGSCPEGLCPTSEQSYDCNTCCLRCDLSPTPSCSPVNGGWSGWSGGYSSECDESATQRRSCNNPSPSCGGAGCSGPSTRTITRDTDGKACSSNQGVCRSGSCVDCDRNEQTCNLCNGNWIEEEAGNGKCCENWNVPNEYTKYMVDEFGGNACCNEATDCAISDRVCVDNLESDYTNENMIDDSICVDGNLMSRTKFIALQLLEIAKNKGSQRYVIFCDDKESALNEILKESSEITNTNNFCVLSLKDGNGKDEQIIIGTTLNPESNFLNLVSSSNVCSNVNNQNKFQVCKQNNIYYNPKAHAVLYSTQEITNVNTPTWTVALTEFLTDLVNKIMGTEFGQNSDISYINQREERYTNIYLNRIGNKVIRAIKEPRIKDNQEVEVILADYEGFEGNICTGEEAGVGMRGKGDHNKRFGVSDDDYVFLMMIIIAQQQIMDTKCSCRTKPLLTNGQT